jgi:tRNA (adenine37-N6)-methyltransferase
VTDPTDLGVRPLGTVRGGRREVEDDGWGEVRATIELDPAVVGERATVGLDAFSHLEVVFLFDRVDPATVTTGTRHPRGNPDWPEVGILAQRGKARPNRLGVSRCALLAVDGLRLEVAGLDAVDGTPVLDVKPWMAGFAPRGPVTEPRWARELMAGYWAPPAASPGDAGRGGLRPEVTVRDLAPHDEAAWRRLWTVYLDFYGYPLPDEVTAVTWRRLVGAELGFRALVAVDADDEPVGFAHLLLHPTTWAVEPSCYLEDLVVDPAHRGGGIGRALLTAVVERARREGAEGVTWMTQDGNQVARRLYDQVATLSDYVRYEIDLGEEPGGPDGDHGHDHEGRS